MWHAFYHRQQLTSPSHRPQRFIVNQMCFIVVICQVMLSDVMAIETDHEEGTKLAREHAKPWMMRKLVISDTMILPFSPVTFVCVFVFAVNLCSWVGYHTSGTWAEASHILVKDTSAKTHKGLVSMRNQIQGNAKLFGNMAEQYSQCPSSKEKGDLGRFSQGTMAPPFDKAVFDPQTPLKQTIGPIQTQFGYHLIYVRDRKM